VSARRPLLTATAAGTLLCALWFVPSAKATVAGGRLPASQAQSQPAAQTPQQARSVQPAQAQGQAQGPSLADTGSVDTTPYLVGGTAFLGLGVAMVSYATRRSRASSAL